MTEITQSSSGLILIRDFFFFRVRVLLAVRY